jgi:acetyl/propionyl-CoA carboxylase alpha subunit
MLLSPAVTVAVEGSGIRLPPGEKAPAEEQTASSSSSLQADGRRVPLKAVSGGGGKGGHVLKDTTSQASAVPLA